MRTDTQSKNRSRAGRSFWSAAVLCRFRTRRQDQERQRTAALQDASRPRTPQEPSHLASKSAYCSAICTRRDGPLLDGRRRSDFCPLKSLLPFPAGFTLQSSTNVSSPAVWSTKSPVPVVISGQNVVTNPISGTWQFFRLSK